MCSEPDGGLTFEASTRRAGTPTRTVPTQRALVDRLVESLVDSPSPDPSAARTLFELLFPNDLKAQAPDTDNLVLLVDRGSAHYPWELLDDQETQEDREPLGVRRGLVRQLEGSSMRSHVLSATSSRALVVGDTASGLSALPAAQKEARNVAKALRDSGFEAEPLIAESGTKVVQALFSTSYRVVHLAGHGVYEWPLGDGTDATVTGMVLGNGMYLTAGEVGQMRQVPELVVVNCCHLGSMGPAGPASPVGPAGSSSPGASGSPGVSPGTGQRTGNYHRLAASFATELIDIGVRVVVACGWAVDDGAAATFATTLLRPDAVGADLRGGPRCRPVADVERPPGGQHLGCVPVLRRPGLPARPRRRRAPGRRRCGGHPRAPTRRGSRSRTSASRSTSVATRASASTACASSTRRSRPRTARTTRSRCSSPARTTSSATSTVPRSTSSRPSRTAGRP